MRSASAAAGSVAGSKCSLLASTTRTSTSGLSWRVSPVMYSSTGGAMGRPFDFWPFSPKGGEMSRSFMIRWYLYHREDWCARYFDGKKAVPAHGKGQPWTEQWSAAERRLQLLAEQFDLF